MRSLRTGEIQNYFERYKTINKSDWGKNRCLYILNNIVLCLRDTNQQNTCKLFINIIIWKLRSKIFYFYLNYLDLWFPWKFLIEGFRSRSFSQIHFIYLNVSQIFGRVMSVNMEIWCYSFDFSALVRMNNKANPGSESKIRNKSFSRI